MELSSALLDLSKMLHLHHGIAPIIIIDEYDTPIQQGYLKDYYDKALENQQIMTGMKEVAPAAPANPVTPAPAATPTTTTESATPATGTTAKNNK